MIRQFLSHLVITYRIVWPLLALDLVFHYSRKMTQRVGIAEAVVLIIQACLLGVVLTQLIQVMPTQAAMVVSGCVVVVLVSVIRPFRDTIVTNYMGMCLVSTYVYYSVFHQSILLIDMFMAQLLVICLPYIYSEQHLFWTAQPSEMSTIAAYVIRSCLSPLLFFYLPFCAPMPISLVLLPPYYLLKLFVSDHLP